MNAKLQQVQLGYRKRLNWNLTDIQFSLLHFLIYIPTSRSGGDD